MGFSKDKDDASMNGRTAFALIMSLVMLSSTLNALGPASAAPSSNGPAPRGVKLIHSVSELQLISSDMKADYALANDIDASDTKTWNDGLGWTPIGNNSAPFKHRFDGRGHTIYGLFINRPTEWLVGLFGYVDHGGYISNLTMIGHNITGYQYVGALAGEGTGNFTNIETIGNVTGYGDVGGMAGYFADVTASHLSSGGYVRSTGGAGGLAGTAYGIIHNVTSSAKVHTGSAGGGLFGQFSGYNLSMAYATGDVLTDTQMASGLVSFAEAQSAISDTYATGNVTATTTFAAGYVMQNKGTLARSYSVGKVTSAGTAKGFANFNLGTCKSNFWDNKTSGQLASPCASGRNTTVLMKKNTYTSGPGWNFQTTWDIIEGKSYPFLRSFVHNFKATSLNGTVNATEDTDYSVTFMYDFFDYPGLNAATSVSTASDCASWCKYNATTHVLSGRPDNGDVGTHWLNITGTDEAGRTGYLNYSFKVNNAPPLLTAVPSDQAYIQTDEDKAYSFDVNSDDEGQGTTTYGLHLFPAWLSINKTTGVVSGTPGNADVGNHVIGLHVDDGNGGKANYTYYLTVKNVNDPPVITSSDVTTASEGAPYHVVYAATDIDPTRDVLTWGLKTDASWLALDPSTGLLQGTPAHDDVGGYWANVTVSDGNGGTDSSNFTLAVGAVDHAPRILTAPVATATEGSPYWVQYVAYDQDPEDTLAWAMATNADWPDMNATTGVLSGTPSLADVGASWVNISVNDGRGGSDWKNFTLTVKKLNHAPVITTASIPTAVVNVGYSVDLVATDIDADALTWTINTTATWLTIGAGSGKLTGTPSAAQVGSVLVKVAVSDGAGGKDSHDFLLTVVGTNHPPTWSKVPANTTLDAGKDFLFSAKASDVDTVDTLTYRMRSDKPNAMTMDPDTGLMLWLNVTAGNYTITVNATDGHAVIAHTFVLKVLKAGTVVPPVTPPNKAPTIDAIAAQQATTGTAFTLKVTGKDADTWDAKNLTFRLVNPPSGMVISADGQIVWTPTANQVGTYPVSVSLSDGKNSTSATFQLNVVKGTSGKVTKETGYSLPWLLGLLVVGLVIGAVIGFVATRKKGDEESLPKDEEEDLPAKTEGKEEE